MNLLTSLRSELLKTKRTPALYFTIAAGAFSPFMSVLDAVFGAGVPKSEGSFIFNTMMTDKFQMTSLVVFPLFIVLICTLLPQIEFRNNAWKQVFASPQTKANVFIAKFINVQLMIVLFLIVNQLTMLLAVVILHFKIPSLHVLNQSVNGYEVIGNIANAYVALLSICAFQFLLGMRFKNFIIPLAIGISGWIVGILLSIEMESSIAKYLPQSFHAYVSFSKYKPILNGVLWTSVAYAFGLLIIGFIDFSRNGKRG